MSSPPPASSNAAPLNTGKLSTRRKRVDKPIPDVPVAFVANTYLDELTERIRQRPIPWEGYHRASLITEQELSQLRGYDRTHPAEEESYAALFMTLLGKLARVDTLQFILVLMDDMLEQDAEKARWYHGLSTVNAQFPYEPLLGCLEKEDEFTSVKAAKVLTFLLCTSEKCQSKVDTNAVSKLVAWLVLQISSESAHLSDIGVQLLASLLKVPESRRLFFDSKHGVTALMEFVKKNQPTTPQLVYEGCFCFWLMTFDKSVAADLDKEYDVIPLLMEVARSAIKEKVIRVVVSTFRNMTEKAVDANMGSMMVHNVLPFIESLSARKWTDEEIPQELESVQQVLSENLQHLSTFDAYVTELESGKLDWTPAHTSDEFWRQNATRLNDRDHQLIKILARLLSTSSNPTVLCVAANDIGQYVKHCPTGKKILQQLGAKQKIMELMTHEDSEVKYQALLAVQKYMVNAWD